MKHTWQSVGAELEHRILHGLACEWENARDMLSAELRRRLRRPLFRLSDMQRRLGCWRPLQREIVVSRGLATDHPWNCVVEVLVHETAHQLAWEVLGSGGETPHGPTFQEACRLLRANPRASGSYPTLTERLAAHRPDPQDRILERIKKLMALAQSRNPFEAEAAMVKAHSLIATYHVDLLSRNDRRDFVSLFVGRPALRRFREAYHLANLLEEFYFVSGLWVPAYVLEKGKMGRVFEITGIAADVESAGYVHDFVERYIESRWEALTRGRRPHRARRTDFAVGVIEGFKTKLGEQRRRHLSQPTSGALVPLEDPQLAAYMAYRYPRTTRFKHRAVLMDSAVYDAGLKAGRELVISKGISERKKAARLKIGR